MASLFPFFPLFSDEVIDFYFDEMKANFAWVFSYMPIGRSFTLELLPPPEQRLWMWRRFWKLVRKRRIYIADFWKSGTASLGCIAAALQDPACFQGLVAYNKAVA